jgi:hypothetical protein
MSLPRVENLVFKHLEALRAAEERAPSLLANKLHANASSAGACARQIGYRVAGTEASNPITGDALFNFSLGDHVHDQIQTAMVDAIPNCQIEVSGVIDNFITVRADLLYPAEDGKLVCGEIKSVSDFGFKLATGAKLKSNGQWNKKDQVAAGPKRENILQGGISAKALGAEYLHVIYARKTAAKDEPIVHEWRFKINDLDGKIRAEIERLRWIVDSVERGFLPGREFEGQIIENPAKVKWPCLYCSFVDLCSKLPSEAIPLNTNAS